MRIATGAPVLAAVLATLALAAATPGMLTAAEYVVDQKSAAAGDENPGTAEKPFKTIGKGVATAQAGDTVVVKAGTYREQVVFKTSGAEGKPITLKAGAGERVQVSGADPIVGWKKCAAVDVRGNPQAGSIYWAEIDWAPTAVFLDGRRQTGARWPRESKAKQLLESGDKTTIVDTKNLTQPAGFWEGGTLTVYTTRNGGTSERGQIVKYDAEKHSLTVDKERKAEPITPEAAKAALAAGDRSMTTSDLYFVTNVVSLIAAPGDYVVDTSVKPHRIYLWPSTDDDPGKHLVEGTRRAQGSYLVGWADKVGYITIDGLEAAYAEGSGFGAEAKGGHHITIENCVAHHNSWAGPGAGFSIIDETSSVVIRRSISCRNAHHGIQLGWKNTDCLVEENMVFSNFVDGITIGWYAENIRVVRNVVYDQWAEEHPDGFQTFRGVDHLLVDSNLFLSTGQFSQIENTYNARFINNLWVGAHQNGIAPSGRKAAKGKDSKEVFEGCSKFDIDHNTLALVGQSTLSLCAESKFRNCVVFPGKPGGGLIGGEAKWESDYNLFWDGTGSSSRFAWPEGGSKRFAEYQKLSGQDAHSKEADPKFRNAPVLYRLADQKKCPWHRADLNENTASKLWLDRIGKGEFAAGDFVEVNFDGVKRTVKESGDGFIVVDPPLAARPQTPDFVVANWKKVGSFALDLRLAEGSPGKGAASDGKDIGSSVDIQAYLKGDFNGDGKRELPPLPPGADVE
jgi:hypothetical protein